MKPLWKNQPNNKFTSILLSAIFVLFGFVNHAFAIDEINVEFSRYFQSDNSGSCEMCTTFNGIIEVKNLSPQKTVEVHYSDPMYGFWSMLQADYIGPSRPGYEYWSFSKSLIGNNDIQFALALKANNQTYWDNNFGSDYIVCTGNTSHCRYHNKSFIGEK